jgi:mRNA interferase RelE/StbE
VHLGSRLSASRAEDACIDITKCYISPVKRVRYTADALKGLKRHANMADRIMRTMGDYADGTGAHTNNVKALQGSSALRLRIGDYRVVFSETETEIVVTGLGPRGRIYD